MKRRFVEVKLTPGLVAKLVRLGIIKYPERGDPMAIGKGITAWFKRQADDDAKRRATKPE